MSWPTGDFTAGLGGDFSLEQTGKMAQPVKRLPETSGEVGDESTP